jgi:hypothetical protein
MKYLSIQLNRAINEMIYTTSVYTTYTIFFLVGIEIGTPEFITLTHTAYQSLALDPGGTYNI